MFRKQRQDDKQQRPHTVRATKATIMDHVGFRFDDTPPPCYHSLVPEKTGTGKSAATAHPLFVKRPLNPGASP